MTPAVNKAAARRVLLEAFNQGNLTAVDEVMAPDYIEHATTPPGPHRGAAGLKGFITILRTAFPDFHYTIEDEIAEGDRVTIRLTARGTNTGPLAFLPGSPTTGQAAIWEEIHIARMADGKCVEHWVQADVLHMMQQLGLMPAPGGRPPG